MSKLDEDLIYEILSVVEEIPEGCVASYGQDCEAHRPGQKFPAGGKGIKPGRVLWRISRHRVVNTRDGLRRAGGSSGCFWKMRACSLKKTAAWI